MDFFDSCFNLRHRRIKSSKGEYSRESKTTDCTRDLKGFFYISCEINFIFHPICSFRTFSSISFSGIRVYSTTYRIMERIKRITQFIASIKKVERYDFSFATRGIKFFEKFKIPLKIAHYSSLEF